MQPRTRPHYFRTGTCSGGSHGITWYHSTSRHTVHCFLAWLGGVFFVRRECPVWCSGGRRPLIAGCLSLQGLGADFFTRTEWPADRSTHGVAKGHKQNKIDTVTNQPCQAFWLPVSGQRRHLHPPAFAGQVVGRGADLPVTRPVWESNLGPPASQRTSCGAKHTNTLINQ